MRHGFLGVGSCPYLQAPASQGRIRNTNPIFRNYQVSFTVSRKFLDTGVFSTRRDIKGNQEHLDKKLVIPPPYKPAIARINEPYGYLEGLLSIELDDLNLCFWKETGKFFLKN
jgi:hypothetical protein